jgi:predicted glutamine amidotransferase
MCRLFGFRSVIPSQVHQSLISAENALMVQSQQHPDGWGVAYYVANTPHVIKSANGAVDDLLFKHVSGVVASETVVAHVRKATQGQTSIVNSHPFQFGSWVFAHNGNVPEFEKIREAMMALVAPAKRRYILGATDSEVIFHLLLTHLEASGDIHRREFPIPAIVEAARKTVADVHALTGRDCYRPNPDMHLSFILTNGESLVAHQGGKELRYSTFKTRCPERDSCSSFAPCCEAATASGFVNHLIVSSEQLQGDNIWIELDAGQMVSVDHRMRIAVH